LAEQGILGLAVFCYVLYLIMRIAFKSLDRNAISAFGFVSILIIWLAFPTYTVSFCWLGIGFFYRFSIADQFMLNKATHNNL
jgi:O-antigen ligase